MPDQLDPERVVKIFHRENVDFTGRFTFFIVLSDPQGQHSGNQSGAETGGAQENVGVTVTDVVGRPLQADSMVQKMLADDNVHGPGFIVEGKRDLGKFRKVHAIVKFGKPAAPEMLLEQTVADNELHAVRGYRHCGKKTDCGRR